MKKNLLFVAALLCGMSVSAQTTWSCITASADGKTLTDPVTLTGTTTYSNIEMSPITWGTGVSTPTTGQRTFKDVAGTTMYFTEEGETLIKWVPTAATEETIKELDLAYSAGQVVNFAAKINNLEDFLEVGTLKLDATRLGTDAVRMNIRIVGMGDASYDSGWLITADNWEAISGGIGAWVEATGAEGEILGYQPSREDGGKAASSPDKGCSSLEIPLDLPADLYEMEVQVCFYGIANNKALALRNVSLVNKGGETGIQGNVTVDENVAPKFYTVQGVEVAEPVKGVNIVKRTMSDGSAKFTKEMR